MDRAASSIIDLLAEVTRLTTERDEARDELLRTDEKIINGQEALIAERDEARAALTDQIADLERIVAGKLNFLSNALDRLIG